MWIFNRRSRADNLGDALRYLRDDDWEQASRSFLAAMAHITSLLPPQQAQALIGCALCEMAKGRNGAAKNLLVRTRSLSASGSREAKFADVLDKACDKDFFADPLLVPPASGAGFSFANMVPVEISFLKQSFLELFVAG